MSERLTEERQVFFPVEMASVYTKLPTGKFRRVPGKRAVVNAETHQPVSVVGEQYQLVTNEQARDLARQCCSTAFPDIREGEWEVDSVDAPSTGGHCRIDLRHSTSKLEFPYGGDVRPNDRPDVYGPFVRVTNSYNGRYALRLVIGFMRKVCSNGLILPQAAIDIRFDHSTRRIADRIRTEIGRGHYQHLREQFEGFLKPLRNCDVPRRCFDPILRSALKISEPKVLHRTNAAAMVGLDASIHSVCSKYARTLGEDGYGLMNAVTEFATNPPSNRIVRRERHGLQTLAGTWLSEFCKECRKQDFEADRYVTSLTALPTSADGSGEREPWNPARQ